MQKNSLSESFLFSGGVNFDNEPFTTYIVDTTRYICTTYSAGLQPEKMVLWAQSFQVADFWLNREPVIL